MMGLFFLAFCSCLFNALLCLCGIACRQIPFLKDQDLPNFSDPLPSLSIVIPALNEAQTIEVALQSLMQQNYPRFEIIAVNDRSTDETGMILDRLAQQDSRINPDFPLEKLSSGIGGDKHVRQVKSFGSIP